MSGLADLAKGALQGAKAVGTGLAEVGLPLIGALEDGGSGMAMGNQLASFVPGTAQNEQRQYARDKAAAARGAQAMGGLVAGSRALLLDQMQELRSSNGLDMDDEADAKILASQDGKQLLALEAINAGLLGGSSAHLQAVKQIARDEFGATFDPDSGKFTYRGKEFDVTEDAMAALRDYAMRKANDAFLLEGIHKAANFDFGAAQQSRIASQLEASGVKGSQALAATRDIYGNFPKEQIAAWQVAEGYDQVAKDLQNQDLAGFEEKSGRLLQSLHELPGVAIEGDINDETPFSARNVVIQHGTPLAKMIGLTQTRYQGDIGTKSHGIMLASEFAQRVHGAINLRARVDQYKRDIIDPQTQQEENEEFYWNEASDGSGREYMLEFFDHLEKQLARDENGDPTKSPMPGITKDELSGNYIPNDALYAEYRRFRGMLPREGRKEVAEAKPVGSGDPSGPLAGREASQPFHELRKKQGEKQPTVREQVQGTRN